MFWHNEVERLFHASGKLPFRHVHSRALPERRLVHDPDNRAFPPRHPTACFLHHKFRRGFFETCGVTKKAKKGGKGRSTRREAKAPHSRTLKGARRVLFIELSRRVHDFMHNAFSLFWGSFSLFWGISRHGLRRHRTLRSWSEPRKIKGEGGRICRTRLGPVVDDDDVVLLGRDARSYTESPEDGGGAAAIGF